MSTHAPLALLGDGYTLEIIPAAVALRDELIGKAKQITAVNSQAEADAAIAHAAQLKGLTKECEACRKDVKAEPYKMCVDIDEKAAEFVAPATPEIKRLENMAGAFVARERQRADEERRKQAEEARKAQEAETARLNAIAAAERAAQAAKGKAAREAAEALAAKLRQEQLEAEIDQAEAAPPLVIETPTAQGAAFNTKIEIFPHDLDALYKAHPQCVELKPRLNAIKDLVKLQQRQNKPVNIRGCEISIVPDLAVRAARSNLAIE
jgi:hypothetical protein